MRRLHNYLGAELCKTEKVFESRVLQYEYDPAVGYDWVRLCECSFRDHNLEEEMRKIMSIRPCEMRYCSWVLIGFRGEISCSEHAGRVVEFCSVQTPTFWIGVDSTAKVATNDDMHGNYYKKRAKSKREPKQGGIPCQVSRLRLCPRVWAFLSLSAGSTSEGMSVDLLVISHAQTSWHLLSRVDMFLVSEYVIILFITSFLFCNGWSYGQVSSFEASRGFTSSYRIWIICRYAWHAYFAQRRGTCCNYSI